MPFRTVAVGDRTLLGRWLFIEGLGANGRRESAAAAARRPEGCERPSRIRDASVFFGLLVDHWLVPQAPRQFAPPTARGLLPARHGSCSSVWRISKETSVATLTTVTVLATTDMHGCIYPHDYFTGRPAARGVAAAATLIREA